MNNELIPDRESLIKVLELIARTPDGQPFVMDEEVKMAEPAVLVGMVDAAVDDIAQRLSVNVGTGKSQRRPVVLGNQAFVSRSDKREGALMHFYQRRLQRLAADIKTSLTLPR
ncbi:hypothetical protein [Lentzea albidocapillata]|uniref:Uncharacterized protein n=1 Tax=Lentzea albidocapillata TaxID=40571 RepID=A0A1W2FQN2_9PSEU|nr:hypothetical protein [Lentzea albidocapillata]SMD23908.1 hypothetical protein SAMN05660733_07438 [Lentzea albidocapillata]